MHVKQLGEWKPAESSVLVESITKSQPDLEGTTSRVWVPAPLMEHYVPSLVCEFTGMGGKRKRKQQRSTHTAVASSSSCQDSEILELGDSDGEASQALPSKGKKKCHDFEAFEILDLCSD